MGLDVSIYSKKQYDAYDKAYIEDEERRAKTGDFRMNVLAPPLEDIVYARGGKYLYDYFVSTEGSKILEPQTLVEFIFESYFELCQKLLPYKTYAEIIWKKNEGTETELDYKVAEEIFSIIGDEPYFDYCREMGVVLQILESLDKVKEIYDSGDSCVVCCSY